MAEKGKGKSPNIIPMGQTSGKYGNDPFVKGKAQNPTPLKP